VTAQQSRDYLASRQHQQQLATSKNRQTPARPHNPQSAGTEGAQHNRNMKASPSRDPRRRSTSIAGRTSLGASGRASLGGRSSLGPAAGSGVPRVSVGASRVSEGLPSRVTWGGLC